MKRKIENLIDLLDQSKLRKQAIVKSLKENDKKNIQLSSSVIFFKDVIYDTKKAIASAKKSIDRYYFC